LKNRKEEGYAKPTPQYKSKIDEFKNLKRSQSGPSHVADRPKKDDDIFNSKIRQKTQEIDTHNDGNVHYDEQSVTNVMRPALTNLDYIYCTQFKLDPVLQLDENAPMGLDKDGKEIKLKTYAIKGTFQFSFYSGSYISKFSEGDKFLKESTTLYKFLWKLKLTGKKNTPDKNN